MVSREGDKWKAPTIASLLDGSFERRYGKVRGIAKAFLREAKNRGLLSSSRLNSGSSSGGSSGSNGSSGNR